MCLISLRLDQLKIGSQKSPINAIQPKHILTLCLIVSCQCPNIFKQHEAYKQMNGCELAENTMNKLQSATRWVRKYLASTPIHWNYFWKSTIRGRENWHNGLENELYMHKIDFDYYKPHTLTHSSDGNLGINRPTSMWRDSWIYLFVPSFRKEMGKQHIFTNKNRRLTHNYYAHLAGLVKLRLKIVSPFDRIFYFRYLKMVSRSQLNSAK